MDAFVQLALMAKAKRVFEAEDTFLSFPALSPLSYPPADLDLSRDGIASARDLARLSEFARITNQIPRGVVAPAEEGEFLWDICSEALALGVPAAGALSAAEQARLDAALALLYVPGLGGGRQESPALATYRACRDAHIAALEEYRNRQSTAESSPDPAERARWAEVEEPQLRQAVRQAEEEWRGRGAKARIEEAMQVEQACAARQPAMAWEAWKSDFLGDIDLETDTDRIRFAPTTFTPAGIFDDPWPRFTLTAAEMTRLAAEAPPELLDIFGGTGGAGDIESVSFEYRSVALTRSWLPKRLFQARFWRFGEGGGELSDGVDPARGRCPAYVTALVFARKVEVRRRSVGLQSTTPPAVLLGIDRARLRQDSQQLRLAREVAVVRRHPPAERAAPVARLLQARPALAMAATARPGAAPASHRAAALAGAVRSHRAVGRPIPIRLEERVPIRRLPPEMSTMPVPGPGWTPTPTPTPTPPPAEAPSGEVAILAFICRRVPRCPDPDPALAWT